MLKRIFLTPANGTIDWSEDRVLEDDFEFINISEHEKITKKPAAILAGNICEKLKDSHTLEVHFENGHIEVKVSTRIESDILPENFFADESDLDKMIGMAIEFANNMPN